MRRAAKAAAIATMSVLRYMSLKYDLGGKLDLPLGASLRLEGRTRDRRKRAARRALVRQREIRMIDEVKEFRPELQRDLFREPERPGQSQIEVLQTIAAQNISPGITKRVDRVDLPCRRIAGPTISLCSVGQQRARVEPAVGTRLRDVPVSNNVGTIPGSSRIALIAARENSERRSGLETQNSRKLPSSGNRVERLVLSLAKRKIVNVAEHESMRHVEVGDRTLGAKIPIILRE